MSRVHQSKLYGYIRAEKLARYVLDLNGVYELSFKRRKAAVYLLRDQLTDTPADACPVISKKIPAGILIGPRPMYIERPSCLSFMNERSLLYLKIKLNSAWYLCRW